MNHFALLFGLISLSLAQAQENRETATYQAPEYSSKFPPTSPSMISVEKTSLFWMGNEQEPYILPSAPLYVKPPVSKQVPLSGFIFYLLDKPGIPEDERGKIIGALQEGRVPEIPTYAYPSLREQVDKWLEQWLSVVSAAGTFSMAEEMTRNNLNALIYLLGNIKSSRTVEDLFFFAERMLPAYTYPAATSTGPIGTLIHYANHIDRTQAERIARKIIALDQTGHFLQPGETGGEHSRQFVFRRLVQMDSPTMRAYCIKVLREDRFQASETFPSLLELARQLPPEDSLREELIAELNAHWNANRATIEYTGAGFYKLKQLEYETATTRELAQVLVDAADPKELEDLLNKLTEAWSDVFFLEWVQKTHTVLAARREIEKRLEKGFLTLSGEAALIYAFIRRSDLPETLREHEKNFEEAFYSDEVEEPSSGNLVFAIAAHLRLQYEEPGLPEPLRMPLVEASVVEERYRDDFYPFQHLILSQIARDLRETERPWEEERTDLEIILELVSDLDSETWRDLRLTMARTFEAYFFDIARSIHNPREEDFEISHEDHRPFMELIVSDSRLAPGLLSALRIPMEMKPHTPIWKEYAYAWGWFIEYLSDQIASYVHRSTLGYQSDVLWILRHLHEHAIIEWESDEEEAEWRQNTYNKLKWIRIGVADEGEFSKLRAELLETLAP